MPRRNDDPPEGPDHQTSVFLLRELLSDAENSEVLRDIFRKMAEAHQRDIKHAEDEEDAIFSSQDQQSWDINPVHGYQEDPYGAPLNRPYVPPRPGFVQRWVSTRIPHTSDLDIANIRKRQREHWRPRRADTLPPQFGYLRMKNKQICPELIVGTNDAVLMERPEEQHRLYAEAKRAEIKRQDAAVERKLESEAHGPSGGYGPPRVEENTSVVGFQEPSRGVPIEE